ncbi:MAG: manganese efflux pump MntP family protein [Desulfovibrio sp.]|jgi:putative Mn2+ efflux pump MntP|nr:manganese efflux pump MntP family protein [Desulfovibrio sp.]
MPTASILAIAVALSMDAFAVSLSTGAATGRITAAQVLRMAGAFGAFQFLMPAAGRLIGETAQNAIESYDHWLAFVLLAFVGGRMAVQALKKHGKEDARPDIDPTKGVPLLLLAVATSVDALAVGISLALLGESVLHAAAVIGLVCFCLCAAGMYLGNLCRGLPFLDGLGDRATLAGGIVLIGIGLKILHEHGIFS